MRSIHLIRRARVYQLQPEINPALRSIGYQELIARQGSVRPGDYAPAFDGEVGSADPETVYRLFVCLVFSLIAPQFIWQVIEI